MQDKGSHQINLFLEPLFLLLEINHNIKFINNHMYENILQVINNNINSLNIKQLNAIIQKIKANA